MQESDRVGEEAGEEEAQRSRAQSATWGDAAKERIERAIRGTHELPHTLQHLHETEK